MEYDTKNETLARHAREYLDRLIGSGATVEVKQVRRHRSKWQNNWLHAVIKEISDYTGYETDETKTLIKRSCGLAYQKNGQWFLKSTSDLDTKEFSEFMDRLIRWSAQEVGFVISDPNQYK